MTMTFQAHDGHGARNDELHHHILRSHLAYLNQEETPAKLEQRRNLESLISEFLCAVSHSYKFTFAEIANILNESIEKNPNFSAYKAQSSFQALEKYATNLISHPWRKEYKTVKLYSGFYKHSVESQLLKGHSVFLLLGYKYTDNGVLYLDEPVDPDKVARVALDCLTAYVECKVMVQICERLKSFKCAWFEIYCIREDYVCGIDEAVRLLHQMKRNALDQDKQDRFLKNQENDALRDEKSASLNYPKTGILVDVSNTWPTENFLSFGGSSNQTDSVDGSYKMNKTVLSHSKLPSWSEGVTSQLIDCHSRNIPKSSETNSYASHSFDDHIQSSYNFLTKSNSSASRYPVTDLTPENWKESWNILHPPLQPTSFHNKHDSLVNCDRDNHRAGYNHTVPNMKEAYTSQFGHLYPPHPMLPLAVPPFPYSTPHDFSLPPRQCQCHTCCEQQLSLASKFYHSKGASLSNFDSDFRSGSRQPNPRENLNDICSPLLRMTMDGSKLRHCNTFQATSDSFSEVAPKQSAKKTDANTGKRGSYYDNVPTTYESNSVGTSLNSKCDLQSNGIILNVSSTLDKAKTKSDLANCYSLKPPKKTMSVPSSETNETESKSCKSNHSSSKESKGRKWSCATCTFYNTADKNICDMCGRSRNPGPENTPLVSGGRECPQCTLVNKKDTENCTACGASLKDSPTYI